MADCPAIARYYLADQDPEQSCLDLRNLLRGTDVPVDQALGDASCRFLGRIGSLFLDIRATDPITEIPTDDHTLDPFRVTDVHGSVAGVRASRF